MRATLKTERVRLLVIVRPLASTAKYLDSLTPKAGHKNSRTREKYFLGEARIEDTKPT
jgi:hypothetical protein